VRKKTKILGTDPWWGLDKKGRAPGTTTKKGSRDDEGSGSHLDGEGPGSKVSRSKRANHQRTTKKKNTKRNQEKS